MKSTHLIPLFTLAGLGLGNAASTSWGGGDTTDVDNWITSSTAFDDTVQSGHSFNWENVTVNTATIDSANNEFDLSWQAGTNYTIGHLYMYGQTFDLSTTIGGLETLTMTADFDSTFNQNWSPVVAITDGGSTRYYRWNHSGNSWNANGALNFSDPFPAGDPNQFDLSQLGNGTNTATVIWGELNSVATAFGGTRDNGTNPNLQGTSGQFQVGFLQWGASTGGNIATQTDFTTAIDSFETSFSYTNIPEPGITLLGGLAGLFLLRRRR